MSKKKLIIFGVGIIFLVNGSIFGTIYLLDYFSGPSKEELVALREAEEQAALQAIYDKLPPLEPVKHKKGYLRSIGEAVAICEQKLHETVVGRKSWEVNMIESRYSPEDEIYKIFMVYQTPAMVDSPMKEYEVACEVSEENHDIPLWKATLKD